MCLLRTVTSQTLCVAYAAPSSQQLSSEPYCHFTSRQRRGEAPHPGHADPRWHPGTPELRLTVTRDPEPYPHSLRPPWAWTPRGEGSPRWAGMSTRVLPGSAQPQACVPARHRAAEQTLSHLSFAKPVGLLSHSSRWARSVSHHPGCKNTRRTGPEGRGEGSPFPSARVTLGA